MDTDPLGDTVPPRHAVESDEEEDEFNPLVTTSTPPQVNAKITGSLPQGQALVVATGDAAEVWVKGASLGEQIGAIMINGVQVGLAFKPAWTTATVVVSEVTTRIPAWAMHGYAEAIVQSLKPTSVALLDSYPVPAYITAQPIPYDAAPLRYLSTRTPTSSLVSKAQTFAPPNMIQSTSAALMSILSASPCTLVLLPSPHIPPPPPKTLAPTNILSLYGDSVDWSQETICSAQQILFDAIGEADKTKWEYRGKESAGPVRKKNDFGEGGMYI